MLGTNMAVITTFFGPLMSFEVLKKSAPRYEPMPLSRDS
jgi:hypothetical protein